MNTGLIINMKAYMGIFSNKICIHKLTNTIDFEYTKEYIDAMEYLSQLYSSYLEKELLENHYIAWEYY